MNKIDTSLLNNILKHNKYLGIKRICKSIGYERTAELPYIVSYLSPQFAEHDINVIDIGTGDSVLPSYLLQHTDWKVTCVDKFGWVQVQKVYAEKSGCSNWENRLKIVQDDIASFNAAEEFDLLICISVIEHFEADSDLVAVKHMANLLKPGGVAIFSFPVNEGYAKDFYKQGSVYGERGAQQTFYQRHYDKTQIRERIIEASGMVEVSRLYFGEYGFPFGQYFMYPSVIINPFKVLYKWAAPFFAKHFVTYSDKPISREDLSMDTAAGAILVLKKKQRTQ